MNQFGILRDIADDELEMMREWRNELSVRNNMYSRHEISREEHLAWWEKTRVRADHKYFMYELDGVPAGIAALTGINFQCKNSAWAFYAAPTAPKGSGRRMEFLMLEYAFNVLRLHKIFCEVLGFNEPVINLHKKFGFKVEGIFRDQYEVDDGFVDVYRFGILADEWQAQRHAMHEKLIAQAGRRK